MRHINMRGWAVVVALSFLCTGCAKKQQKKAQKKAPVTEQKAPEKKTYFHRDEWEQSSSFQLIQHMTYQELEGYKNKFKKSGDLDLAIKYIGQMVKKCENPDTLRQLYLELDDLMFESGHYDEAAIEYQRYMRLYPGDQNATYAHYRAIVALHKKVLGPDRDQTRTHEVVKLAKEFAVAHKNDQKFMAEVEGITSSCMHTLYQSEVLRFYFYLNRNQFKAARARLDYVKKNYLPYLSDIEPEIMVLEYELELECQNNPAACACKDALCKKYPKHQMQNNRRSYASIFSNIW